MMYWEYFFSVKYNFRKGLFISGSVWLFIQNHWWTIISTLQQHTRVFPRQLKSCYYQCGNWNIFQHKNLAVTFAWRGSSCYRTQGQEVKEKSFHKHNSSNIPKHYFISAREKCEKIGHNWFIFVTVAFGCTFMHAMAWTRDQHEMEMTRNKQTSTKRYVCVYMCVTQRERRRLKEWFKRLSHPLIMLLFWVGSFNLKQKREAVGIRDEEDDTCGGRTKKPKRGGKKRKVS